MYTKRFIKGPLLHEERSSDLISATNVSNSTLTTSLNFTGNEAKRIYDEIISIPSTAGEDSKHVPVLIENAASSSTADKAISPPPKLGQLMRLCENNNYHELRHVFEIHSNLDIDETDQYGWTLLMCASCAGAFDCVDFLLQVGADWSLSDKKGLTASSLAQKNSHKNICCIISNWEKKVEEFQSQEISGEESGGESEGESITVDDEVRQRYYCESCNTYFSNRKQHSKSIAHLVSTSKFVTNRTHYGIPESNKGFQLMLRTGWDRESGLGPDGSGSKFPIKTVLKRNRKGLGNADDTRSARITHFAAGDPKAVEREPKPEERLERKRTLEKKEEMQIRNREKRKEINFRRELGPL